MARSFGACLRQVRSVSIQMSRRVHELAVFLATSPGTVVTSALRTVAQRTGAVGVLLIVTDVLLVSALEAYSTPFWHDEMYTAILSQLPDSQALSRALSDGVDGNPPLFYYLTRFSRVLIPDDHVAYRTPSIAGFLLVLVCIYAIVSTRVDRLSALAASSLLLALPVASYAYEARPYTPMVACVCCAVLAWQRVGHGHRNEWALGIGLAGALSFHYYAALAWPAFIAAECARWYVRKTCRPRVWVALCLGALPLVLFRDHLATLREVYGQNLWAPPSPVQVITGSDWLFGVRHLGFVLVMGIATGIAYRIVSLRSPPQRLNTSTSENTAERWTGITEEEVLSLGLLAVPAIGVTVATIMGGDLDPRYMLTAVVGGAIGVGLLLGSAVAPIRWFVLFASLGAYALRVPGPASELLAGTLVQRRVVAAQLLETTIRKHTNLGVPIVVSDGLQYLPLTRYIAPDLRHDLYALVDPTSAVDYVGSDSVDRNLQLLRGYVPLQIVDYADFASAHRSFLMVSSGERFDWLPTRLVRDGHDVTLVANENGAHIYRVAFVPSDPVR